MQKASDFNIRDAKVRPQKYYYQEENFMRKNQKIVTKKYQKIDQRCYPIYYPLPTKS